MSLDAQDPDAAVFTCEAAEQRAYAQQSDYAQQSGGSVQQGGYAQQSDYAQHGSYTQQGQAQQGGYAQQAPQQQALQQLPYPWVQMADQNGALYYSNPLTGEASWDPPQ